MWPQVIDSMRLFAKALFKASMVESVEGNLLTVRLPNNTPMPRVKEHTHTLLSAVSTVCGGTWRVNFVVADPTSPGGIPRPVLPANIAEEVAADPEAAVDPTELVDASGAEDPIVAVLKQNFPGGFMEEQSEDNGVTTAPRSAPRAQGRPAPRSRK